MDGQQFLWASFNWPWDAVRASDGSVVMIRGARWRYSFGGTVAGLAFAWTCIYGYILYLSRPHLGHLVGLDSGMRIGFLGIALLIWTVAVCISFLHEEWQAHPGLLSVRRQLFGFSWAREFEDGELRISRYLTKGGPQWRLSVKTKRTVHTFANVSGPSHWRETKIGTLAQALGEATGFPLEDEMGVAHRIGYRLPIAGAGPVVAVRRLHTGQVLMQIPGSTLAGANLPGIRLSEADLQGTDLRGANLQGADLRGASLGNAKLMNAKLGGAHLAAADLSGADLTDADLTGATYDVRTRWPAGFDPARHGAVQS